MNRKGRIIAVSFKDTEKDKELYEYLNNLDDKSAEIKKLIRIALKVKKEKMIK